MDNQLNYYNIKREYALKFFQVPKVFMTNDKYKKLSAEAKLAFAVLSDRLQLSIKNHWFDKEGNIYFIYTGEQLEQILGCGHSKVTAIKKELTEAQLLVMKRMGQGKANRMYLLEPEISEADIYNIDQLEAAPTELVEDVDLPTSMNTNMAVTLDNTRLLKNGNLDYRNTVTSDTDINNTDYLKPLRTDTNKKTDTLTDNTQNIKQLQDAALFEVQLENDSIFSKQQLLALKLLSNGDFELFCTVQKTILRAKKQALNSHQIQSSLFDLHDEDIDKPVYDCLMRIVQQVRLGAIQDVNNYVFSTIFDQFEQLGNRRAVSAYEKQGATITWE